MQTIKLIDLCSEIKGSKNIKLKNIQRVLNALPKVISRILLSKKEVKITPFFKMGFRVAKDRMVKSNITNELVHIPQHIRFKGQFYQEFKTFINSKFDK